MRILFVHPNDVLTTPTTVRIVRLAQELARKGHKCVLVSFIEDERRSQGSVTTKIEEIVREDCRGNLEFKEFNPYEPVQNSKRLASILRDCDLIHLQKAIPYSSLPSMTAAVLARKPLHYDWDDLEEELAALIHRRRFYPAFIRAFERRLPRFCRSLTYASEELKKRSIQLGADEKRLSWLPVGTDLPECTPQIARGWLNDRHGVPRDAAVIVYSGHLEAGSGAKLFIDTVRELISLWSEREIRAFVLGGGLHSEAYRAYVARLNLGSSIVLTGYLPRKEVPMYLSAADVNVVSVEDSLYNRCKSPLKLLEAMAAGKPVVASAVGEIPRLLGEPGLLASPDPRSLAARCREILTDGKWNETGQKLRARVESGFTWAHAAERLEKAYVRT